MGRACLSKIILKPAVNNLDLKKSEEAHLAKSKSNGTCEGSCKSYYLRK